MTSSPLPSARVRCRPPVAPLPPADTGAHGDNRTAATAPPTSRGVGHFQLPQVGHFRLPLTPGLGPWHLRAELGDSLPARRALRAAGRLVDRRRQQRRGTGGCDGNERLQLFRFFDADNWEILIKVLDGCAVNGHHWVYGASTTDLGYEIRVRDTTTDDAKVYRNEPGRPAAAITDDKAFPGACGAGMSSPVAFPDWRLQGSPGEDLAPVSLVGGSESGCVTNGTSLCLANSRFEVKVGWSTGGGGEGSASTVPGGTNNSGLFYWVFRLLCGWLRVWWLACGFRLAG